MRPQTPYEFLDHLAGYHVRRYQWKRDPSGAPRFIRDVYLRDIDIQRHIDDPGGRTGLAFIAPGESTCRTALFDLDDHARKLKTQDVIRHGLALAHAARMHGLKAWLNTSSSGRGVHVRFFWQEPQDAHSVRALLAKIAEGCNLRPGTKGLEHGEVEVFPKQDRVEPGGYGNMAWLPFNSESQLLDEEGNERPLADLIGAQVPLSAPVPVQERPVSTERGHVPNPGSYLPELGRLQSALAAIPNERDGVVDYETWVKIGYAIHHATQGSDAGLVMFQVFSERSPRYDLNRKGFTDADDHVWKNADRKSAERQITEQFIYNLAAEHGWRDPDALKGMEVEQYDGDYVGPAGHTSTLPPPLEASTAETSPTPAGTDDPVYPHFDPAAFAARPRPPWHVRDYLPATDIAMLYGESGAGKSFVALDMGCAIALGREWWGSKTRRGRVGYVIAEGVGGFSSRLRAWSKHRGVDLAELAGWFKVVSAAPNLLEKADTVKLIDTLRAAFGGGKPRVDVVFIDTVARVTAGANENSGEDMGRFLRFCEWICRGLGCTVVLIHHAGKDIARGARGWSGIKAAMDAELEVAWDGARRSLRTSKMKDGRDDTQQFFELHEVVLGVDEDLEEITSCVPEPLADEVAHVADARSKLTEDHMAKLKRVGDNGKDLLDLLNAGYDRKSATELIDKAMANLGEEVHTARWKIRQNYGRALKTLARMGLVQLPEALAGRVVLVSAPGAGIGGQDELLGARGEVVADSVPAREVGELPPVPTHLTPPHEVGAAPHEVGMPKPSEPTSRTHLTTNTIGGEVREVVRWGVGEGSREVVEGEELL